MRNNIQRANGMKREYAIQRILKTATLLALVGAAGSLYLPGASDATQSAHSGSAFCASRSVKTDPTANFEVRLAISRTTVPHGGTVQIRIENPGTVDAAYGYPYRLQRHEQNGWVNEPVGPFFSARLTVRSGRAGICQTIHMAHFPAPGTYRVSKSAWPATAKDERPKTVMRVTFRELAEKAKGS